MKTSPERKGDYTESRDSYDAIIKAFYIKYCKILNKVTLKAKTRSL